ncbi:MAG: EVE domain-containing protein [Chloroflexi bacterium]|nr:EVE domain-containing protein [Chloroflexota bacterium]
MGKNYWMMVASPEDFEITKEHGFTIYGVRGKYRRRAQRMQPEDRVLYYVKGLRKWTATATITSQFFEDHTPIWNVDGQGELYPFRVRTRPEIVLEEEDYIDALMLAPRLEYVKRWAPEDWPLAFFESLHLIPQKDFRLIEAEMTRIVGPRRSNRGRNGPNFGRDRHYEGRPGQSEHYAANNYPNREKDGSRVTPAPAQNAPQTHAVESRDEPYDEHEVVSQTGPATGQTDNQQADEHSTPAPEPTPIPPVHEHENRPPLNQVSDATDNGPVDEHEARPEIAQPGSQETVDSSVEDHPATGDSSTGSSST